MRSKNMKKRMFSGFLAMTMVSTLGMNFTGMQKPVVAEASAADYGLADKCEDGNILHCFNWKLNDIKAMLPEIAQAGFTSVQTSPLQPHDASGQWYWLYQPTYFTAGNDLGSKEDLRALCTEADKYGIKIIVDVVANHLAGNHQNIDPELKNNSFYHNSGFNSDNTDWNNRWQVTHCDIGMPDLVSENSFVQQKVRNYIQELKGLGVDGLRFDAAKHIGVPSEGCDFWPNVLDSEMYNYGEILDSPGGDGAAVMKEYTKYMGVTDSQYGNNITRDIRDGKMSDLSGAGIGDGGWVSKGSPTNRMVYWAESHDTFCNNGWTRFLSESIIDRSYAVSASRANSQGLYLSRPSEKEHTRIMYGLKGSTHFTSKEIAAVNHLHNAMVGQKEYLVTESNCDVVVRGNGSTVGGATLVNVNGGSKQVSVKNGGSLIPAGTYKDEVSGNTFTVTSSTISGQIGDTGIAVIYTAATPQSGISASLKSGSKISGTATVTLNAKNVTNARYTTSEGDSGSFTDGQKITLGASTPEGSSVTLTLTATSNDGQSLKETYTYSTAKGRVKPTLNGAGFIYDNSQTNWSTVTAYVYDESSGTATTNGSWPGVNMKDAGDDYFVYELDSKFTNTSNVRVIFSNSGANQNPGAQQPGFQMTSDTMIYENGSWSEYSNPVTNGTVVVNYQDASGKKLAESVTYTGKVGESYTTTAVSVSGYTLSSTPTNATGKFAAGTTTVTYVYNKNASNDPVVNTSLASGSSFSTETAVTTLSLENAVKGTYSVDNGPVKEFTGTAKVTLGRGKVADSTVTVKATATSAAGATKEYTFTYNKKYEVKSSVQSVTTYNAASNSSLASYYSTNKAGFGANKTITVDGDISDWDSSMIIAQGTANDDPRVYRPNSMYEVPLDLYTLYAAYDDNNVYLMWEMTNVQDVVAPGDDYPLSQGVLYNTMNIPFFIAINTNKSADAIGNKGQLATSGTIWGSGITFENSFNRLIAISTNGANGPYVYAGSSAGLDATEKYGPVANATKNIQKSGIQFKYGMGIKSTQVWGLDGAYGTTSSTNPRTIGDMCNENGKWVDFNTKGHKSATMDFHYEMSIPLSELGITKSDIVNNGIGAMVIMTSGKSGMDCLPYDLAMNDQADLDDSAGSQENNSFEKSDEDHITAAFAGIGKGGATPPPVVVTTPLQVNFGADRSAPQSANTALKLSAAGYGGTAPYTYEFKVDGKTVKANNSTTTANWTATAGEHTLTCIIKDAKGSTATVNKGYTVEGKVVNDLSVSLTASKSTVAPKGTVTLKAAAAGGSGSYKYTYTISANGNTANLASNSSSNSYNWTAGTATGTKTLKVTVTDSTGKTATASTTVTVQGTVSPLSVKLAASKSTVATKGTATLTATAAGGSGSYKYTYSISANGKTVVLATNSTSKTYNWTAGTAAGTKTFTVKATDSKGKTATASTTVTVQAASNLSVKLAASSTVAPNTTATLTATAAGGSKSYKYTFIARDNATGTTSVLASNQTSNVYKWNTGAIGSKTVSVVVTDSKGATASSSVNVTVKKQTLAVKLAASKTTVATKGTVALTATASGATGACKYTYSITANGKTVVLASNSTSNKYNWTAGTATGTKTLTVKVTDAAGKTATSSVNITVSNTALSVKLAASKTTVAPKTTATLTASAVGGSGSYKYTYSITANGKTVVLASNSTSNTYNWTAGTATGTKTLTVKVTDAAGKTATSSVNITVGSAALSAKISAAATTVNRNTVDKLTVTAAGGAGNYKYTFVIRNNNTGAAAVLASSQTSNVYNWNSGSAGSKTLTVVVTDAKGATATASVNVTVK